MGISEILKKADLSNPENDKKNHKLSQDDKLDEILSELKAIYIVISKLDQHITAVDNNLMGHINELMERKKEIPVEKKLEVEDIIKKAKSRTEAIEKLRAIGISQATAYRYTELFEKEKKKE